MFKLHARVHKGSDKRLHEMQKGSRFLQLVETCWTGFHRLEVAVEELVGNERVPQGNLVFAEEREEAANVDETAAHVVVYLL